MIRELLGLAVKVLAIAAVLGIGYGIGDFRFYGGGQAGARAGLRSLVLVLTVLGAPFFLIAGYAALRVRSLAGQGLREARDLGYDAQLIGLELNVRCRLSAPNREEWVFRYTPTSREEQPPFPPGWEQVNASRHPLSTALVVTLLHTANVHKGGRITYESRADAILLRWDLSGWDTRGGGRARTRDVCASLQAIAEAADAATERLDA